MTIIPNHTSFFLLVSICLFTIAGTTGTSAKAAPAEQQEDVPQEHLQQLYELGFLKAFLTNTSESIQEIITELTEEQQDPIFERIILEAFVPAEMETVILSSLRRSYRTEHAEQSISHLQQPDIAALMGQLYNNQTDFDDEKTIALFEDFINRIESSSAGYEERISIVSDIINRSQTTRLTVQTLEDFLTIIIFTLNQTNDEDERLTDRQVNELIISLRTNFRQLFDNVMLYVTLYSTQDIDQQVLARHAEYLGTESGRWFIRTYNNAVLNSFGEVSEKVASSLADWALSQSEDNED